jgi:phosphoglycolate phosphatase-like HAD superfamily hydrolase
LQDVHRKHGDSEHPFALLETRAVHKKFGQKTQKEISEILDPAFHAFNRLRKQNLRLYDGAYETLEQLSRDRVPVVAHTDARVINSLFRLKRLGVKNFISRLYAPGHVAKEVHQSDLEDDFVRLLPPSDRKPNPQTLVDICLQYRVERSHALYVGDSLLRDVYMANRAGLHSAWAKFGTLYDKALWPMLVRITHWTDADLEREKMLKEEARGTEPEVVLDKFSDLTRYFEFKSLVSV